MNEATMALIESLRAVGKRTGPVANALMLNQIPAEKQRELAELFRELADLLDEHADTQGEGADS